MKPTGIFVYISHWEDHLVLSPAPGDEHLFRGVELDFFLYGERSLVFTRWDEGDGVGNVSHPIPPDRHGGLSVQYAWHFSSEGLARFCRHPVELQDRLGEWIVDLPENHELPWPFINNVGRRVDFAAVAAREFRLRLASAYEHGGLEAAKRVTQSVPRAHRALIDRETWSAAVREVTGG